MMPPMLSRGLIGAAFVVYLIVLGCVMMPSDAPAKKLSAAGSPDSTSAEPTEVHLPANPKFAGALPYRGAAMQIQRVDWIDKYKKGIDEIAALGLDTISLVIDTRMENGHSSTIWLDMRMTPTPDKLADLIQHAKSKGLRVVLMPVVLLDKPQGSEWRGTIKPEYWPDWFDSYRSMLIHFAWIAEQNHVDVLSVGSELVSAEKEKGEWSKTIQAVRAVFHGQLTYSANWDHYTSIPFWDQLDLIATNCYYKLGDDKNVTIPEIKKRWAEIQHDLLGFTRKKGKPLMFTEVGWCSMANAADEPWDYTQETVPQDDELQKKLYQAFFESWWGNPAFGGFMIWEWSPGNGGKGDRDQQRGYTPENKPAEAVLKEWLAKPRWQVKGK